MKLDKPVRTLLDYLGIGVGCLVTAAGLVWFLVPNKIAAGGVSGLATVIFHVFQLPVGLTMLAFNIPLFIMGVKQLGFFFGIKSLYGTILLSVMVDFLEPRTTTLTADPLLASLYGGITIGIGLAIVFRYKGSTGGTTLAAQLINAKLPQISIGKSLLVVDFLVILIAGLVFNLELALYATIAIFITAKAIDVFQEGMGYAKACYIISEKADEIAQVVMNDLNRGATLLQGYGAYTGEKRQVLMSVVSRAELSQLKEVVIKVDPKAFVIVTDAHEALGEGFKNLQSN